MFVRPYIKQHANLHGHGVGFHYFVAFTTYFISQGKVC